MRAIDPGEVRSLIAAPCQGSGSYPPCGPCSMGQGVGPIVMAPGWMGQRVFARASGPPFKDDELGNLLFLVQELDDALIESGQEFEKAVAGASISNDVTDPVITKGYGPTHRNSNLPAPQTPYRI